jgi:hypothetical protein
MATILGVTCLVIWLTVRTSTDTAAAVNLAGDLHLL